jgi:hypothetical protein
MRVALLTKFAASKKEQLAVLLERIHAAFLASGPSGPLIQFSFCDAPVPGFVSSVDRVLKRHPQLERFVSTAPGVLAGPAVRQISNTQVSPAAGQPMEFATLLAIAAGVPKSFPFHNLSVQFHSPAFGETPPNSPAGSMMPGVIVGDSWWVNGRVRSVSALTIVEADPACKKLPPPPDSVAAVFAACGKAKTTVQVPLAASTEPGSPAAAQPAGPNPEAAREVAAVVRDYRTRLAEILDRAALPHDLQPALEALQSMPLGENTGPMKPVLVQAFKPLGYNCKGGSGTFTLRRRTPGNLTVEISLDVGTWSRSLTAFFRVHGLGFKALLPLPVSKRAMSGQYPIGGAEGWRRIVDNLAALVTELDRSFVPAVAAAAGPSPEWYAPES